MKIKFLLLPVLLAGLLASCENQPKPNPDPEPDPDPIPVESISLDYEEIDLEVGDTKTLSYTVLPENASDKSVVWSTDDSEIVSVTNGKVKALSEGSTYVYVTTKDGNKEASCYVTVSEPVTPPTPDPVETKTAILKPKDFDKETHPLNTTRENITFDFNQKDGQYVPGYYTGNGGQFTLYAGNELTIATNKGNIKSIDFAYRSASDLLCDVGAFNADFSKWTGSSKEVIITVDASAGTKVQFNTITVTYEVSAHHDEIDLGVKTIKEVKEYITQAVEDKVFDVNAYGMGVDPYTTVTIKGLAMAKLHLSKTTESHGYNLTEPNKVVIGDDTDSIAVASKTGDGTLYKKVDSYQMESDSKYSVKGYISMNLGTPELICTSYEWNKTQSETANIDNISKSEITLSEFYEKANAINYNISGFGYGETYTIKGLTCYYSETGGSGKTWYNFTDGTRNIRINAYNVGGASVGLTYDVTGIISMENYSPILIGYKFTKSQEEAANLNEFYKSASEMNIENLKNINYVNDTDKKYPDVIDNYSKIYKTTGYITTVEESGRYYLGISDVFFNTEDFPNNKASTSAEYNIALIKNNNFWNIDDPYFKFNPYKDVTDTNEKVTIYYTPRQTGFGTYYKNGQKFRKMYWEILLIPQSIPVPVEA